MDSETTDSPDSWHRPSTISGRVVVVGIFVFGIVVTGTLYVYWDLHTAPFRPLQEALAREFKDSHPLVQGGQRRIRKNTPLMLRVVLRVDFDPNQQPGADAIVKRVVKLAREHHDLAVYDILEIHLAWLHPEKRTVQRKIVKNVAELLGHKAGD